MTKAWGTLSRDVVSAGLLACGHLTRFYLWASQFPILLDLAQTGHLSSNPFHYRPQTKLREGNVFTPVCRSFCSAGGLSGSGPRGMWLWIQGMCLWVWGCTPPSHAPLFTHPLDTHSPGHTPVLDTPRLSPSPHYGQQTSGIHPTGMLSCW